MRNLLVLLIFVLVSGITLAQSNKGGVFNQPVMPGPSGTWIWMYDTANQNGRPEPGIQYVVSKRGKKSKTFQNIVTLGFPQTSADLEAKLGQALLTTILQERKISSSQELFNELEAGNFGVLGIFTTSPQVMQALGMLYIDKEVTAVDAHTTYKVERINNGAARLLYEQRLSDVVYTPFPRFKTYQRVATDSAVMVTWFAVGGPAVYAQVFDATNKQASSTARVLVYQRSDTLFATYSTLTNPGDRASFFIRATDLVGNAGIPSDTVSVIALNLNNSFMIHELAAADSLNGIVLTWKQLPAQSWFTGIRIMKSRSAVDDFIVVDTLPPLATSWVDRRILPGTQYYYIVEPIVYDLPQHTAVTPARVTMHATDQRQHVLPPQHVKISVTDKNDIRLSWMPNPELNLFAYYILRGTSKDAMEVISEAVRDTIYVDSSNDLHGGISYLYAVKAMDMDMHMSDTSATVSIIPSKARFVTAPGGLSARYTQTGVRLYWNDVVRLDALVVGYVLYKRRKGEKHFEPIVSTVLTNTWFIDSMINQPGIYEYGCASIDAWNNQSILSATAVIEVPGSHVSMKPPVFHLRNLSSGVEVSIPMMIDADVAGSYIVYRRLADGKSTWQRIGETASTKSVFVDTKVTKNQLYVYAVAVKQGTYESGKSIEQTIRRK